MTLHKQSMAARRAVLGDAYVDAAMGKIDDFARDFQNYCVRPALGKPGRRGLDIKIGSIMAEHHDHARPLG